MRVCVVGATGLIGRHLVASLVARGDEVVAVSRRAGRLDGLATLAWTPDDGPLPEAARVGTDAVVNLAGEPITPGRWSEAKRRAIRESRVAVTRGVAASMGGDGPRVLVNGSAVGYYGRTEDAVDEAAPPGDDFLASVCVEWEDAAVQAASVARVVVVRTGVVLAADGGALPPMLRVARLGLLGTLGDGRQWVPWVHLDDEVAALLHCLDREEVVGPRNVVAPRSCRQAQLARAIRRAVHRPAAPPAPAVLVRAALGPSSDLVLTGQRVVPAGLDADGFRFAHPDLDEALDDLVVRR